jgi:hypothetical protein
MILLFFGCALGGRETATGQLHWPFGSQQERIRLRVVGRVMALPKTSFFANHEVLVAEKAINNEEGRLIKLVYEFLPYQPSLDDVGMDYSNVYEVRVTRDPQCDESLGNMIAGRNSTHDPANPAGFKYAADAPELTVPRHPHNLPCYETSADDFGKTERVPLRNAPSEPPVPTLKVER